MNYMILYIALAVLAIIASITWFIISCVLFAKDRKNKTKPHSTGILVNFILSCVFLGLCLIGLIIFGLFVLLVSAFFASM